MIFQNLQKPVFMARMAVQEFCVPVTSSLQIPHAMWLSMFTDFLPHYGFVGFPTVPPSPLAAQSICRLGSCHVFLPDTVHCSLVANT